MANNSASFLLAIILELRDKASGGLDKFASRLRSLQKDAKGLTELTKALEKLGKGVGKGGGSAGGGGASPVSAGSRAAQQEARALRELTKLKQDQVRLSREEARAKSEGASQKTRAQREEIRLLQEYARLKQTATRTAAAGELSEVRLQRERIRLLREEARLGESNRRGGRAERFNSAVRTGRNALYVADRTFDAIRGVTDPAIEQLRARERFRVMGFSDQENARADTAIQHTVQSIKGVRTADAYETLTGLINTFGEVDEALKFLPISLKYRANMGTLYGDQYGPTEVTRQISNTFKALETLGIDRPTGPKDATGQPTFSDQDRARMEQYFNIIAKATAATGGEVNPNEFRLFTKYSRLAGPGLTPEGLAKVLPVVQQMGGASTGTAMMTLYSNMVGGRIPSHKLQYWDELGLLDKSKVEFNEQGKLKRLRPGAIPIAEGLGRDPVAVADKFSAVLASKGIDVKDYDQVNKQLMAMFGDRTGAGALAQMINFRASIEKEVRKNENALGINEIYARLFEQPNVLGQRSFYEATKTDTLAAAGKPITEIQGSLSEWFANQIKNLQTPAGEHPAITTAMVGILALGKASVDAADGVGIFNGILRGGGSGGGGGAGVAGSGYGVSDVLTGGWAVGKGVKRVGTALGVGLLPRLPGPAAIAALAGVSGWAIHSNYQRDQEKLSGARQGAATQFDEIARLREQHGGRLPADLATKLSAGVFPGVDRRGLLHELAPKTYGTAGYPGVRVPTPNANEQIVGEFRRQGQALQFSELMAGFIRDVRQNVSGGRMTTEAGDRTLKIAEQAFPESYKQAVESTAQQLVNLSASVPPVQQSFVSLNNPAALFTRQLDLLNARAAPLGEAFQNTLSQSRRLPTALEVMAQTLTGFGARVNSINFEPNVSLPFAPPTPATPGGAQQQPRFVFSLPRKSHSAIGSVVHSDGVAMLHKGNVVFPAHLSRRAPGDWLNALMAMRTPARESSRAGVATFARPDAHSLTALAVAREMPAAREMPVAREMPRSDRAYSPANPPQVTIENFNFTANLPNVTGDGKDVDAKIRAKIPEIAEEVADRIAYELERMKERK